MSSLLKKSVPVLFVVLFCVAAFYHGTRKEQAYLLALIIWGLSIVLLYLWSKKGKIWASIKRWGRSVRNEFKELDEQWHSKDGLNGIQETLLLHVCHRITDILQSKYSDATWSWITEHPEKAIEEGGTARIYLYNVPQYQIAELDFNRYANIEFSFIHQDKPEVTAENTAAPHKRPREQPDNAEVWYALRGKQRLEDLMARLKARGFKRMIITEQGEAVIEQGDKHAIAATILHFPVKEQWPTLVSLLKKDSVEAAAEENHLALNW